MTKICDNCKKEFNPRPTSKSRKQSHFFCSRNCKIVFGRINLRCNFCHLFFTVPKRRADARFCSTSCAGKSKSAEAEVTKKCFHCNKHFRLRRVNQKFCSINCFNISKPISVKCLSCETLFLIPKSRKLKAKFCSTECKNRLNQLEKKCVNCEKSFLVPKSGKHKYFRCSLDCRKAVRVTTSCAECNTTFVAKKSENKVFCSGLCYHRFRTRYYQGKKFGGFNEKIWQQKLKYWGFRCYLCKKDLLDLVIHREHRKPLSRGGTNWIANIAPACQECNLKKSTKTEKEFRDTLNTSLKHSETII